MYTTYLDHEKILIFRPPRIILHVNIKQLNNESNDHWCLIFVKDNILASLLRNIYY